VAERPFQPVPNTPLVADPTGDAIWKRWLQGLQSFLGSAVRGPGSSTDNAVARWDGTSGQFLNNSGVIIDDSNNVSGVASLTVSGLTSGRVVFTDTGGLLTTATTKTANTVFAGPTTGADAVPAFRALVTADLPGGLGTVTSVAVSGSNGIGVSGSPITTSGTITLSLGAITPTSVSTGNVTSSSLTSGRVTFAGASGLLTDTVNFRWNNTNKFLIFNGSTGWALGPNEGILYANSTDGAVFQGNGTSDVSIKNRAGSKVITVPGNTTSAVLNGTGSALSTSATDGFTYIPECAGTPTGTPTAVTGAIPLVVDSTNHKLYFYSGGAWQWSPAQQGGTGAPNNANGNDGDFYFRGDGTVAGSNIVYHKEAGAWVALTGGGGGGASGTTVEVDLGTPKFTGKFTITDAAISATSKVQCWQAPGPYTGKGTLADEAMMQPVQIIAVAPAAGSAVVYWQTPPYVAMSQQLSNGKFGAAGATFDRLMNQRTPAVFTPTRIGKVRGNVKFTYTILT